MIAIERLRVRLAGPASLDARLLAERVAEAIAVGAPGLGPGGTLTTLQVRLPAGPPGEVDLAPRIASAMLDRLGVG